MGRSRRLGRERRGRDGRSPPPRPPPPGKTPSTAGGRELSARSPPPCCFNSDVTPWDGSRFGLDKKSRVWLNAGSVGNEKNTVNKKDRADPLTYSLNPTNFGLTLGVHFNATNGAYAWWSGQSSWWIIQTMESFNGTRFTPCQGDVNSWFATNAFGGSNYSNTPVGGVSNVDEPALIGNNSPGLYLPLWASGHNLAQAAWISQQSAEPFYQPELQVVGDPFVKR